MRALIVITYLGDVHPNSDAIYVNSEHIYILTHCDAFVDTRTENAVDDVLAIG